MNKLEAKAKAPAKPKAKKAPKDDVMSMPAMSPSDRKSMQRYEAEDALRTLTRAAEIKKDTKLMRAAAALAEETAKAAKAALKSR